MNLTVTVIYYVSEKNLLFQKYGSLQQIGKIKRL